MPIKSPATEPTSAHRPILLVIFFASGAAALVYEVLWLKELGLLFGNTAQAAATTLAVFFLGLAAGSRFMGKRAAGLRRPLAAYAILEVLIAASALLYFLLVPAFQSIYTALYPHVGTNLPLITLIKLLLGFGLLFPPAFFMGGTLPAMGQHLIRSRGQLGRTGTLLYAANTVGAAVGALLAGFWLPAAFGFTRAYAVPMAVNLLVAVVAWAISRSTPPLVQPDAKSAAAVPVAPGSGDPQMEREVVHTLAFLSGFLALGLEVLWTRMFAQVLHNSVYSFTAILVTFLVALALGSLVANLLCRLPGLPPRRALMLVSVVACALVVASPMLFVHFTDGLAEFHTSGGWSGFVVRLFGLAALVMLLPGVVLGTVYPYLLKVSERFDRAPGHTLGDLAAINSLGGILGSLVVGFVVLTSLGLWASVQLFGAGYLAVALIARSPRLRPGSAVLATGSAAALAVVLTLIGPGLPLVRLHPGANERVVDSWETRSGTVAVVEDLQDRWILVDNHYSLGGVQAADSERRQAQIPLFVQPEPKSVYFLGMGTGITAGGALDFPVQRVVTCELIPEVITAARRYFSEYTNGLFSDPRSELVVEDGRHYLLGTRERFDLIVSDLFVPWHAGTGSLYSREHYEVVRERLAPGGLFVQWLGGFQISRAEFDVVARTLLEVFPQVVLWRADFLSHNATLGFFCSTEPRPLDPETVSRNVLNVLPPPPPGRITDASIVPYVMYGGNITAAEHLFRDAPLNTDDHPVIEYMAPRTQQAVGDAGTSWLVAENLVGLLREMRAAMPLGQDPYLGRLSETERNYVAGGLILYEVGVLLDAERIDEASRLYREFLEVLPLDLFPGLQNAAGGGH